MRLRERLARLLSPGPDLGDVELPRLGDEEAMDPRRVGGKAASLSRLAARWPVPAGFCVPVELHRRVQQTGARRCRRAVRRLVAGPYRSLDGGRPAAVAVRSSAVAEDGTEASFAGQHDTVLNAVGERAVARAVLACCASATSELARAYRDRHGIDGAARMAVLVQRLVDADVSAVAFSANPITGSREEVLINASYGLGGAVVDGTVTPDSYTLRRDDLRISDRRVADKDVAVVPGSRGTGTVEIPAPQRHAPALRDGQCREIAAMVLELEREMGWPVDVECAYDGRELFLLQCRPVTALPTS